MIKYKQIKIIMNDFISFKINENMMWIYPKIIYMIRHKAIQKNLHNLKFSFLIIVKNIYRGKLDEKKLQKIL